MDKIYIIDFDSTLVTLESLDELARIALAGRPDIDQIMAQIENITNQGMSGEIGYDESLDCRLKLFSADRQHIIQLTEILKANISPSLISNIEWFRQSANSIYIVSGGFEDYIAPVIHGLGLGLPDDRIFANRLTYDDSGNITGYDQSGLLWKPLGKVRQVEALGLSGKQVIMIGDGHTDFEVKANGAADEFWAFTETVSRPQATKDADRVINSFAAVAGTA